MAELRFIRRSKILMACSSKTEQRKGATKYVYVCMYIYSVNIKPTAVWEGRDEVN
jgi:hypothetical protein